MSTRKRSEAGDAARLKAAREGSAWLSDGRWLVWHKAAGRWWKVEVPAWAVPDAQRHTL